jgi:hypothetical protein
MAKGKGKGKGKHPSKPNPNKTKEFDRIKKKVGRKQVARNETSAGSVSTKRVTVPVQSIGVARDILTEALVGLRHFNDRKRIDSIYAISRLDVGEIGQDKLSSLVLSVGYCLSDTDSLVRQKCGNFLVRFCDDTDSNLIRTLSSSLCIQIRAAVSSVNPEVRNDALVLLERLLDLGEFFDEQSIMSLLKTVIDLGTAVDSHHRSNGDTSGNVIMRNVINLLQHLVEFSAAKEEGIVDSSEWSLASVINRITADEVSIGKDIGRLLNRLIRSGESETYDEVVRLCGRLEIPVNVSSAVEVKQDNPRKSKSSGGVFSKLAKFLDNDS